MVEFNTILSLIQAAGILVGVAYYILNIENNRKNQKLQLETRQAALFMQLYQQYTDKEWFRMQQEVNWLFEDYSSFDEFMEKYGPHNNMEGFISWGTRANFYEGLGMLVKRGFIDASMVDDLISGGLISYWEKRVAPMIYDWREQAKNPAALEWVEYLYHEVKQIKDQQHPEFSDKTPFPEDLRPK